MSQLEDTHVRSGGGIYKVLKTENKTRGEGGRASSVRSTLLRDQAARPPLLRFLPTSQGSPARDLPAPSLRQFLGTLQTAHAAHDFRVHRAKHTCA